VIKKIKAFTRQLVFPAYFIVAVAVLLEIALRIYNPFHFRIKGDNIVLDTNKKYTIDNSNIPVLEKITTHSKNLLGFRGPEVPADFAERLTIVTIGGSTTECSSIGDGKTWTDVLYNRLKPNRPDVWINNAGLAGHSTYGHIALMKDRIIPLKPDYSIILVGVNDIGRDDLTDSDKSNSAMHHKNIFTYLSRKSELCNVVINLARNREARRRNLTDTYLDLTAQKNDTLFLSDSIIQKHVARDAAFQIAYKQRLTALVNLALSAGIQPVLVTQPMLLGKGDDPVTGVNLETIRVDETKNGRLWWAMLEAYNEVTRQVATENKLLSVDLARELPKDSRYFYDAVHFTNEGCAMVGEIIFSKLQPL
jgi:lysophospholipase L1-like esterase